MVFPVEWVVKYFIGNFCETRPETSETRGKNQSVTAALAQLGPIDVGFEIFVWGPTLVWKLRYGWSRGVGW